MEPIKYLHAAYRTDTNENPFGRDFVGYVGWHNSLDKARAAALAKFPEVPAEALQVNVA